MDFKNIKKCDHCGKQLESKDSIYPIKIYDINGELKFLEVCSQECANKANNIYSFEIIKCEYEKRYRISFKSKDKVSINSYLKLMLDGREYYFRVYKFETIDENYLLIKAEEDYTISHLGRKACLDIRDLLHKRVSLVTDIDTISKIRYSSNLHY